MWEVCIFCMCSIVVCFFFSSRRRQTRCALVTGVQTCALPISFTQMAEGDAEGARASLEEARAIARRVSSPGLEAMAVQGLAHVAVTEGERRDRKSVV